MERIFYSSLHLLSMISLFSLAYEAAASVAKSGCLEKCGNMTVPYPFGIGKGFFLDEFFVLGCNTSFYNIIFTFFVLEVYEFFELACLPRKSLSAYWMQRYVLHAFFLFLLGKLLEQLERQICEGKGRQDEEEKYMSKFYIYCQCIHYHNWMDDT